MTPRIAFRAALWPRVTWIFLSHDATKRMPSVDSLGVDFGYVNLSPKLCNAFWYYVSCVGVVERVVCCKHLVTAFSVSILRRVSLSFRTHEGSLIINLLHRSRSTQVPLQSQMLRCPTIKLPNSSVLRRDFAFVFESMDRLKMRLLMVFSIEIRLWR